MWKNRREGVSDTPRSAHTMSCPVAERVTACAESSPGEPQKPDTKPYMLHMSVPITF